MGNTPKSPDASGAESLFHLFLGGEELGPFTVEEVRQKLRDGECSSETLAWKEGQSDWAPISTFSGLSVPPRIRRTPPPPPASAIPLPSTVAEPIPPVQGLMRPLLGGFLLPLFGFALGCIHLGFFGVILVALGGYNCWRGLWLANIFRRGRGWAWGCVAFNVISVMVTLLMVFTPNTYRGQAANYRSLANPTVAAWNVLVSAIEGARNAPPEANIGSTLTAELSAIAAIDDRGVDRDLSSLIHRRRELLQRELQVTSLVDSEAKAINDNAQVGTAMLELLFSAAGAQNDADPWRGASRGQQAGAEMAYGIRLNQFREILQQHQGEIVALKNEESALGAELIQLEQKLRVRYPGSFNPG